MRPYKKLFEAIPSGRWSDLKTADAKHQDNLRQAELDAKIKKAKKEMGMFPFFWTILEQTISDDGLAYTIRNHRNLWAAKTYFKDPALKKPLTELNLAIGGLAPYLDDADGRDWPEGADEHVDYVMGLINQELEIEENTRADLEKRYKINIEELVNSGQW